jgi:hypothetical protein
MPRFIRSFPKRKQAVGGIAPPLRNALMRTYSVGLAVEQAGVGAPGDPLVAGEPPGARTAPRSRGCSCSAPCCSRARRRRRAPLAPRRRRAPRRGQARLRYRRLLVLPSPWLKNAKQLAKEGRNGAMRNAAAQVH